MGREALRVTADTNILVRALTGDDPRQSLAATRVLAGSDRVAIPLVALCELVWVLSKGYRLPPSDIATAMRGLIDADNVAVDWPAAEAGLRHLDGRGDFADGVIAFDGARLGAETFLSFDRLAVGLVAGAGGSAQLLA